MILGFGGGWLLLPRMQGVDVSCFRSYYTEHPSREKAVQRKEMT